MAIPKFLQPEVVPYTSIELVIAGLTAASPAHRVVCAWCDVLLRNGRLPASHGMCPSCSRRFSEAVVDVELEPLSDGPVVEVAIVPVKKAGA